jgi:uncharacterized protein YeaO (DUF488 family)
MKVHILTKRVYETAKLSDGKRILVDRLWPRGLTKADVKIDLWVKEIAPSTELRKWYKQEGSTWQEFKRRYFVELDSNETGIRDLLNSIGEGPVTFVFSSKEERLNNAAALKEYVESRS